MEQKEIVEITTDIVLIDVVGYSLLTNDEQLHTVNVMNDCLSTFIPFMTALSGLSQQVMQGFIPTGDGAYVILNHEFCGYGIPLGLSIRNHLLWTSKEFLHDLYKGIRVAVHMGKALPFRDITGTTNYVGDGLNDCSRLLAVDKNTVTAFSGDSNYIVASESALYWFNRLFSGERAEKFLSVIQFRCSDMFAVTDKHNKEHNAYLIEGTRHAAIQPPNLKRKMDGA